MVYFLWFRVKVRYFCVGLFVWFVLVLFIGGVFLCCQVWQCIDVENQGDVVVVYDGGVGDIFYMVEILFQVFDYYLLLVDQFVYLQGEVVFFGFEDYYDVLFWCWCFVVDV